MIVCPGVDIVHPTVSRAVAYPGRSPRRAAASGATVLLVVLVLAGLPGGASGGALLPVEHHRTSQDTRDLSRELRTLTTRLVEASRRLHNGDVPGIRLSEHGLCAHAAPAPALRSDPAPVAPVAWGVRLSLLNLPPPTR